MKASEVNSFGERKRERETRRTRSYSSPPVFSSALNNTLDLFDKEEQVQILVGLSEGGGGEYKELVRIRQLQT